MSKTIKELADALGVSKTAVRKYMTPEFRCEHTETNRNGVITIDSDGCKLIAESLGRTEKLAEFTENEIPETAETTENSENLVIPRVVWDALQAQLVAKDKQIENLTEAVKSQAQGINGAQALHAGTMKELLPEASAEASEIIETVREETVVHVKPVDPEPLQAESEQKPGFWKRLRYAFSGEWE